MGTKLSLLLVMSTQERIGGLWNCAVVGRPSQWHRFDGTMELDSGSAAVAVFDVVVIRPFPHLDLIP